MAAFMLTLRMESAQVFTRILEGGLFEGVVSVHLSEAGEYGLEVFAYDPVVSPSGSRLGTHVWSAFLVADSGSARCRTFPEARAHLCWGADR